MLFVHLTQTQHWQIEGKIISHEGFDSMQNSVHSCPPGAHKLTPEQRGVCWHL